MAGLSSRGPRTTSKAVLSWQFEWESDAEQIKMMTE
jgi:hypothetical protein